MKPYLIDVPVLLFVFIRPNTLERVFKAVKRARPKVLILASDGPRDWVSTDKERILKSRKIVESIDWDCQVYKLYFETNQGLYEMIQKALDFTFEHVDRCILLEDDVIPSQSFFPFCAQLLDKYKDDLRVNAICGMNHLGVYKGPETDYFFSEAFSIWGFAIWKRTYQGFYDSNYGNNSYVMERLRENTKKCKTVRESLNEYYTNRTVAGHLGGPEFFLNFIQYSQNRVNIITTKNLIKNVGFVEGSTHSPDDIKKLPKRIQMLFDMKIYKLNFPLKHPEYVIADRNYERKLNRIMANNHPLIVIYRRLESVIRRVRYGEGKLLYKEVIRRYVKPLFKNYK